MADVPGGLQSSLATLIAEHDPSETQAGHVVAHLDAIGLVQAATGNANEPLDPAAADGPNHRVDDETGRRLRG